MKFYMHLGHIIVELCLNEAFDWFSKY